MISVMNKDRKYEHILMISQNKAVSQMRAPLTTRREPAGNQNKATKGAVCLWT